MESLLPYLQSLGEVGGMAGVATIVTMAMVYMFLHSFSYRAFKVYGLEEIKLPFGIYLKRSNAEDNADADALIIEGLYEAGQQLEYRAKEKMRAVMQQMAYDYSAKYPAWREYILRGRIAVSAAISDNHIVYSLTDERIHDYIAIKQDQVVAAVCEAMVPDAEKFIRKMTAEFFLRIIKIQKWLCNEKIAAYEEALHRMRMEGSKLRCETKIQKNKKYLAAIAEIEGSAVHNISPSSSEMSSVNDIFGADIVQNNIERIASRKRIQQSSSAQKKQRAK